MYKSSSAFFIDPHCPAWLRKVSYPEDRAHRHLYRLRRGKPSKARDICVLEAQGRERIQRAELEERLAPSDEHKFQVEMARIEARHAVERGRCDDLSGPARMACAEKARDEFMMSKADALISHRKTSAGSQLIGPNMSAGQPGMDSQEAQQVRCHRMPVHERIECIRAGMGHHGQPRSARATRVTNVPRVASEGLSGAQCE